MQQIGGFGPNERKFYIDGAWTTPQSHATTAVINPATEEPVARIALGNQGVDHGFPIVTRGGAKRRLQGACRRGIVDACQRQDRRAQNAGVLLA